MREVKFLNTPKTESYSVIGFLKFPLSCIVVAIHCFGTPLWSIFAVPGFFLISGYLFYNNFKDDDLHRFSFYFEKYRKRIKSLLIPYVIWNLIFVAYLAFINKSNVLNILEENNWWHILWDCNKWGQGRIGLFTLSDFTYFPVFGPLWYVRELLICVLFSPIITLYVVRGKKWGVLLLGVLFMMKPQLNVHCFTLCALFFFSWGGYLSINRKPIYISDHSTGEIIIPLTMAVLGLAYLSRKFGIMPFISYNIYIILALISIFYLAHIAIKKYQISIPTKLAESSFMVYMLHKYYLDLCWWVFDIDARSIYVRIVAFVVCISLSVSTYHLLKTLSPTFLKVINGR